MKNAFTFVYDKLASRSENTESPIGNLLRCVSKIYYRNFNNADSYYDVTDNQYGDGYFYATTTIKDKQLLYKLQSYLEDDYYENVQMR